MKIYFCSFVILLNLSLNAQPSTKKSVAEDFSSQKYLTFNPFAIFEPQATIGVGFANHFSETGEYYAELSYLTKTPFYEYKSKNLSGYKLVAQYRYHFMHQQKSRMNKTIINKERQSKYRPFIGFEIRLKSFKFSGINRFYNKTVLDTITGYDYTAKATVFGGAVVFGSTYKISKNGKLNLEATIGLGGRMKFIKYLNLPNGYAVLRQEKGFGLAPPQIDEAVGLPYLPIAIKIRYLIN